MKSYMAKKGEFVAKWHLVDATDKVLGRISVEIATILMGKHRPEYTPHVDTGDFVVVINASKVKLTGNNKAEQRLFQTYTYHPSGQRNVTTKEMLATRPEKVVIDSVRRMLPKTKLGLHMITKLKVYGGSEHPHQAQNPAPLEL